MKEEFQGLGESRMIPVEKLRLDAFNPRMPESLQGSDQESLAVAMEIGFEAFAVAANIARFGFFASEPLIAVEDGEVFTVVEGNRRLTALLGLTSESLRSQFATPERWHEIAKTSALNTKTLIPVVIAPSKEAVIAVIGWRHISGILPWEPYAQARYVATLVDGQGFTYEQVAELIGKRRGDVASLYRDQAIADQASRLGIDTGNLEHSFSLLQVAMSTTKIREFVGAPIGGALIPGTDPIPTGKAEELKEVLGYIYGSEELPPVITDSRQISSLGNVISEPSGLAALRDGESLDAAKQRIAEIGGDPRERLLTRLTTVKKALLAAFEDYEAFADDDEVIELFGEIIEALSEVSLNN